MINKENLKNWTQCTQLRLPPITARPPKVNSWWSRDSLSSGGTSDENLVISRENRPEAEQSPGSDWQVTTGWVYDFVQGQENRPASDGSRKIAIRQKIRRSSPESSPIVPLA